MVSWDGTWTGPGRLVQTRTTWQVRSKLDGMAVTSHLKQQTETTGLGQHRGTSQAGKHGSWLDLDNTAKSSLGDPAKLNSDNKPGSSSEMDGHGVIRRRFARPGL